MSDQPQDTPPTPPTPDAAPFDRIVDDYEPRQDALNWAIEELIDGRPFEPVHAELLARGWSPADADEIVEEARQFTRPVRGATTRDDVLRQANRHYRRGMSSGWFVGFPSIAAVMRLAHSLAALATLKRRPRSRDDAPPHDPP